jgi:phosphoribosylformylglycinamidine synthase
MVFIRGDHPAFLADGVAAAPDGNEVQRLQSQKQFSEISACHHSDPGHYHFKMAGSACHRVGLCSYIFAIQKQKSMKYTVQIKVMPLKELLDPQGKAVMGGLENLGLAGVEDVRIGKNITLQVNADSPDKAKQIAEEASKKLLANPVMEYFEVSVN